VISPLLANIYLNVLDKVWKNKRVQERFRARLIRYADDFVMLCGGNVERVFKGIERVLEHLELELNEEKTKVLDAKEESFNFLGFRIEMRENPRTRKIFPLTKPSKETLREIKTEIKALTCRKNHRMPKERMIKRLNEVVRGWSVYFHYGHCSKELSKIKDYLNARVRIYLREKHRIKNKGYKVFPYSYLYGELGLYKIPTRAPWTSSVKAFGKKMIGKPYLGKPNVRFDEGELEIEHG